MVSIPALPLPERDPVPLREPDVIFMFVDAWPNEPVAPSKIPVDEPPPEPTFCEVHVGPESHQCSECISGLFVCPAHFMACGGEALICCFFCWRVLCNRHAYCPCSAAISRRRDVALAKRNRQDIPPIRGSRGSALGSHVSRSPVPHSSSSSCLSPGPRYNGPDAPDPELMVWPFSAQPDWPINDSWREFAFDTVVLSTRSPSPSRRFDDSFSDI